MKELAGRPLDVEDIANLRRIQEETDDARG